MRAGIEFIYIKDFMSIGEAKLTFDESGILNIQGYNDSGKSAVIRALGVCLADKYTTKQTKFIRDGKNKFVVTVGFSDGVTLTRIKYKGGKSLLEMRKGDEILYTNRVGETLGKLDVYPDSVKAYLGLVDMDGDVLNMRLNTDPSFLAETSGSENFRMLNEVLKSEEISRAVALVNSDRNEAIREANKLEHEFNYVREQKVGKRWATRELVDKLREAYEAYIKLEEEVNLLNKMQANLGVLSSTVSILDVPKVKVDRYSLILDAKNILDDVSKPVVSFVPTIKCEQYVKLQEVLSLVEEVKGLVAFTGLDKVEYKRKDKVESIQRTITYYLLGEESIQDMSEEMKSLKKKLKSCVDSIQKEGKGVTVCRNCGEVTITDA